MRFLVQAEYPEPSKPCNKKLWAKWVDAETKDEALADWLATLPTKREGYRSVTVYGEGELP